MKPIAGTGHRPDKLGGYSPEAKRRLDIFAYNVLRARPEILTTGLLVISGMAQGWDQAIARAAITLKHDPLLGQHNIRLLAAVPFEGQESKWPLPSQWEYRDILRQADEVVVVSEGKYTFEMMDIRNRWMVDHAAEVLALWNGSKGGTANCVNYALQQRKPITNVWSKWNE